MSIPLYPDAADDVDVETAHPHPSRPLPEASVYPHAALLLPASLTASCTRNRLTPHIASHHASSRHSRVVRVVAAAVIIVHPCEIAPLVTPETAMHPLDACCKRWGSC